MSFLEKQVQVKIAEFKSIPNFWKNRAQFIYENDLKINGKSNYEKIALAYIDKVPISIDNETLRAIQIEKELRDKKIWCNLKEWKKVNSIPKEEHNSYTNFGKILARRERELYEKTVRDLEEMNNRLQYLVHDDGIFDRKCFNEEGKVTSFINKKGKKVERLPFTYWCYEIMELRGNYFDGVMANLIEFLFSDLKNEYEAKPNNRIRFVWQKSASNPTENKENSSSPFTTFDKFIESIRAKFGIKYDGLQMHEDDLLYFEVTDEIAKYLPKHNPKAARLLSLAEKKAKDSLINIVNTDDLCVERCIITHIAREIKYHRADPTKFSDEFQKWDAIRKGTKRQGKKDVLTRLASELFQSVDSQIEEANLKIQYYVNKLKMNLYIFHKAGELETFYECIGEKELPSVFLYYYENEGVFHADLITSITAFLGYNNAHYVFCEDCKKIHTKKSLHCVKISQEDYHNKVLKWKPSAIVQNGKYKCKNCRKWVPITHECNVAKTKLKSGKTDVYYWDSEAYLSKMELKESFVKGHPGIYKHTVSSIVCGKDTDKEEEFKVFDTTAQFVDYFMELPKIANPTGKSASKIPIVFLAHNSSKYDTHFIMKELYARGYDNCKITGSKSNVFCLTVKTPYGDIFFKDSYKFIPIKLKDFPKIFDLPEARKGTFPYGFNTPENKGYIGPIPDKKYFSMDNMSEEELSDFIKYHADWVTSGKIYNLREKELIYCKNDVFILQQGFNNFREQFMEIAKKHTQEKEIPTQYGDPVHYMTIAGIVKNFYTSLFMMTESLPVLAVPQKGKLQSIKALMWLSQVSELKYEYKLPSLNYTVDGFDEKTNTVYEYYGDFWHGNPEVFEAEKMNPITHTRYGELYDATMIREEAIKKAVYNLITIWENDYDFILNQDYSKEEQKQKKQAAEEQLKKSNDLNIRDAFFGGRTEVFSQYFDALLMSKKLGKTVNINYADICSLYPTVMYYDQLPTGKSHNYRNLSPSEVLGILNAGRMGIIKCDLLPPKDLLHPVCAAKQDGKLQFHLVPGQYTITSVELLKAVEKGYEIKKVYSALIFESKTNNMFKEFIKVFLKIKTESSGLEAGETKDSMIKTYKDSYGIDLDADEIKKNPGRRTIAKLCLNSLWGKFGQRNDFTQHKVIAQTPLAILKEIYDPNISITDFDCEIIEDKVHMSFKKNHPETDTTTSIITAIFITANARMRLYDLFEKVGDHLLYCDTDSIVYYHIEGEEDPIKLGTKLGDLTNEISFGAKGKIFASSGPKSYSLQTTNPKADIFHCKGITLDRKTKKILNSETMKEIVIGKTDKITTEQFVIRCTRRHDLYSYIQNKDYKNTFDKREVLKPEYFMGKLLRIDTVPFGYEGYEN
jgi:hypothetical protein